MKKVLPVIAVAAACAACCAMPLALPLWAGLSVAGLGFGAWGWAAASMALVATGLMTAFVMAKNRNLSGNCNREPSADLQGLVAEEPSCCASGTEGR